MICPFLKKIEENDKVCHSKRKNSSFKSCCFVGCTSTTKSHAGEWHTAPKPPKTPKVDRFEQIKNHNMRKKSRFVLLDKLGSVAKTLKEPTWCDKHLASEPFKSTITFFCKGKNHTTKFKIDATPNPAGHKHAASNASVPKTQNKGGGVDRHNINFMKHVDISERLGMQLSTEAYSPDRVKHGVEKKKWQELRTVEKELN